MALKDDMKGTLKVLKESTKEELSEARKHPVIRKTVITVGGIYVTSAFQAMLQAYFFKVDFLAAFILFTILISFGAVGSIIRAEYNAEKEVEELNIRLNKNTSISYQL